MESARINRVFQYILNIDPCSMKLSFGIEKMLFDLPLLDYTWGRYRLFACWESLHALLWSADIIFLYTVKSVLRSHCTIGISYIV